MKITPIMQTFLYGLNDGYNKQKYWNKLSEKEQYYIIDHTRRMIDTIFKFFNMDQILYLLKNDYYHEFNFNYMITYHTSNDILNNMSIIEKCKISYRLLNYEEIEQQWLFIPYEYRLNIILSLDLMSDYQILSVYTQSSIENKILIIKTLKYLPIEIYKQVNENPVIEIIEALCEYAYVNDEKIEYIWKYLSDDEKLKLYQSTCKCKYKYYSYDQPVAFNATASVGSSYYDDSVIPAPGSLIIPIE